MGLRQLLSLDFERFVGLRYLHRSAGSRGKLLAFLPVVAAFVGLTIFLLTQHVSRPWATVGVVLFLFGLLASVVALLLRFFSVFTTVSTIGVTLGVASLVVVLEVTSGFEKEFQDKVLGLNAHLIVMPYGDTDAEGEELEKVKRRLRDMPGIVRIANFVFTAGEVMVGRVGANLKGVDLTQGADDLRAALTEGRVEDLARPATCPVPAAAPGEPEREAGRIVLGSELARRLRVKVGGCVPVMIPFTGDVASPPAHPFKVVGLFRMGFHEYDTRLAFTGLSDIARLGQSRVLVTGVELRFADPMAALDVTPEIQRRLAGSYRIVHWKDLNKNLFQALWTQKLVISLLLVLIIVVAAFNIIASLTMIVLSKVREIAILKSMGARAGAVARVFMVAGTTVGGVGTALGIGYGITVCRLAAAYGYPLDPKVYLIAELPVRFEPMEILGVAAATLGICFLATLYPALRAARMRAVDGLRYD